jgi:hypothetical protein
MKKHKEINLLGLRGMYILTSAVAGLSGLGILISPDFIISIFDLPEQEPLFFAISGTMYLSLGLLAIIGWKSPIQFIPLLLFQLFYKVIWLAVYAFPLILSNQFPMYGNAYLILFILFVIGDIYVIPFRYFLVKAGNYPQLKLSDSNN